MIKKLKTRCKKFLASGKSSLFFINHWGNIPDIQSARNLVCAMRHSHSIPTEVSETLNAQSILIIAPHPDDELIGCGGALIKCKETGGTVHVFYLTQGSRLQNGEVINEIKKSAEYLGYSQFFLDFYAKEIKVNFSLINDLANYINQLNPDAIFLPFLLDDHDDHRIASQLIYYAAQENLLKWKGQIWAYQVYTVLHANRYLNITDVIDKKCHAISFLNSQLKKRDWIHYVKGLNAFNSRFSAKRDQKYLESYFVLPLSDYLDYCRIYFSGTSSCYKTESYNQIEL